MAGRTPWTVPPSLPSNMATQAPVGVRPGNRYPRQPTRDPQAGILGKLLAGITSPVENLYDISQGDYSPLGVQWVDGEGYVQSPEAAIPFATEMAGVATTGGLAAPAMKNATGMGIRAYHGSPHDFDRFSMDKIGTGEGAQAYGHGLYFAENEGVAQGYRDALKMKGYDNNPMYREAVNNHGFGAREFDQFESIARQTIHDPDVLAKAFFDWNDEWRPLMSDPVEYKNVRDFAEKYINSTPKGRMYEVDINASPDEFLDWDKPLSEQSPRVQEALVVLGYDARKRDYKSGAHFHDALGDDLTDPETTDVLRSAGIKGIRYKDAGSRSAEGGTSNYVVFDDNIIDILKKYGIAGLTAGGAGAAAVSNPDESVRDTLTRSMKGNGS